MASFQEFTDQLSTTLADMPLASTPQGVAYVEGYTQCLQDLRTAWLTSPLWSMEVTRTALPLQIDTIRAHLEERLATDTPAAAASGGVP
jgi:hypothetical protein